MTAVVIAGSSVIDRLHIARIAARTSRTRGRAQRRFIIFLCRVCLRIIYDTIRYGADTIRDAIITCARKLNLPHGKNSRNLEVCTAQWRFRTGAGGGGRHSTPNRGYPPILPYSWHTVIPLIQMARLTTYLPIFTYPVSEDGIAIRSVVTSQSCPWVGLTHRLGWVGSGWVEIFQLLVGWDRLGPLQQKY